MQGITEISKTLLRQVSKIAQGAFINNVMQISRMSDPPPPSVTLKCFFTYNPIETVTQE